MKNKESKHEKFMRERLFKEAGEFFREARKNANMSLQEVADLADCRPQFICNIEAGKAFPPTKLMLVMIKAYRIDERVFLNKLTDLQVQFYKGLYFNPLSRKKA